MKKRSLLSIVKLLFLFSCIIADIQAGQNEKNSLLFDRDTVVNSSLEISEKEVLTINPGVTVRIDGYLRISVKGVLIAQGTKEKPIVITGINREQGSTDQPCWQGIEINGKQSNAVFRHCRIEGAFRNIIWEARPLFDSCKFTGNHYALYCTKKAVPHITNCLFSRNKYGIVADFASPLILDNVITENSIGIQLQLSSSLIAGRNIISNNEKDIRSEQCFGETNEAFSSKYLWDLMRQLY
jgi:parallel beta-helix repeat protein